MNFRTALILLIALACGLWDACVAGWLPFPLNAVRLTLPGIVVLAAFSRSRPRALIAAAAGGAAFDAFAPSSGGFMMLRLIIIALSIEALTSRLFTNRTLAAAVVIGVAAVLEDRLLLLLFEAGFGMLGRSVLLEDRAPLIAYAIWSALVVVAFFFIFAAFGRRFLPLVTRLDRTGRIPLWKS